jgi:uncharacterized protein YndB with AHSA1/START domain
VVAVATPRDPVASDTFHLLTPACAARVWSALTCPETAARYLHGLRLDSSWEPHAPLSFGLPGLPRSQGQVLCVRGPELLSYVLADGSGTATYLTWSIRPVSTGCVVRLHVHETHATGSDTDLEEAWLPVVEALRLVLATEDQPAAG